MLLKNMVYSLIVLTILSVSGPAAAQDKVALATRQAQLHTLAEQLRSRDRNASAALSQIAARMGIPLRRELPNGGVLQLQRFVAGAGPIFYLTYNVDAADTVSTDEVWPGGSAGLSLDGSGMTVGEWDSGAILSDHPDLLGRVSQVDGARSISNHSTHVAGTLIGSGVGRAEARGMAYAAHLNAYDWNSDSAEMAAAAADGLLTSNHSYGIAAGWTYIGGSPPNRWWWFGGADAAIVEDANFGYYDTESQIWDQIAFDAPYYLIVKAAGNDRSDSGPQAGESYTIVNQNGTPIFISSLPRPADCAPAGYDCLPTASVAKNILTVGSVNDIIGGYLPSTAPASVQISGFSSWGPTDDGRIKPDVVGNGWLLTSTLGQDPFYDSYAGTSMAAPNVTGSLLLLQEHYQNLHGDNNFMRAATVKGLVIHTADETGAADGPDYQFGWGLLNTKTAAEVITLDENGGGQHQIIESTLANGATDTIVLNVSEPNATITVTLAWTDPPGSPAAPSIDPTDIMLVNDLDLRVVSDNTNHLPWTLNPASPADPAARGDNFRDNVEQLAIDNAEAGIYTVRVSHKGGLLNGANQNYSLIISNDAPGGGDLPGQATDPNPANGSIDVDIEGNLSWSAGSLSTSRDVYFGTSSSLAGGDLQGNQSGSSFDPGTLADNTVYYWRIDEVNNEGTTQGNTWSFTTEAAQATESMHGSDLDGEIIEYPDTRWRARVTLGVHDENDQPLSGVVVTTRWGIGASGRRRCTTDATGYCTINSARLLADIPLVSLGIDSMSHTSGRLYIPQDNHDPDGDSDGGIIEVSREPSTSNNPPTVTINSPAINATFTADETISFTGSAMDDEDGDLAASLAWDSNIDGAIGAGASFSSDSLSEGDHNITATVTDSEGASDSTSVAITVGNTSGVVAHVASLADLSEIIRANRWDGRVAVTVTNVADGAVASATVRGTFRSGSKSAPGACVTDNAGLCIVSRRFGANLTSVSFTVDDISGSGITYAPEGSTTSIEIFSPL